MGEDEAGTLSALKNHRAALIDPATAVIYAPFPVVR